MTVVRAVLLLVLCTVGGWLGLKAGTYYLSIDTIKAVLGGNQRLGTLSQFGFMVIGVLAGGLLFGKVIAYGRHRPGAHASGPARCGKRSTPRSKVKTPSRSPDA